MIMRWVKHAGLLSDITQSPVFANEGHVVLDPDMDERRLKRI